MVCNAETLTLSKQLARAELLVKHNTYTHTHTHINIQSP